MPKAVIYARFSSHNQREESIEQQVAECQAFAKANDLTVVDVYADAAVSGRSDRRPQFQRLRRDAAKKAFEVVIAYKSSRIARNMLNALTFEVEMNKSGVTVLYAKEEFGNTAAGRFALRTMISVNQFYSENLGEDIKRTQADNARQCKSNGPAPYGYRSGVDGRFEIDESAAAIVREIYTRTAAGESNVSIMRDLNARHLKTRLGHEWGKNSFQGILGNERYLGIYIFDGVRVPGGMPRIIDDKLFKEAMIAMSAKKKKNPEADYQLTGKLYCGECGEMMIGMSGTGKSGTVYNYYACSGRRTGSGCKKASVGRDQTEIAVASALLAKIMDDAVVDQIADEIMDFQQKHKNNPEIKALEAAKADNKKAIDNILDAIEAGIFTDTTKDRLLALEAESKEITERLEELTMSQLNVSRDQVVGYLKSYRGGEVRDRKYRMKLFQTFLVRAYVYDDRLKIVFDPIGEQTGEVNLTLDEVDGESGDGVRLMEDKGHHISATRTLYLIYSVPFTAK